MLNCKCYHCKMQDVDGVSVFEFTIIVRCTVEQKKDAIEKVHCIPIKSGVWLKYTAAKDDVLVLIFDCTPTMVLPP